MYTDAKLIFVEAADAAAVTTKAISLLQGDHPGWPDSGGRTDGAAPSQGLYLVVRTGADLVAGSGGAVTFTAKLQHADTQNGAFADLLVLPSIVVAASTTLDAGTVVGIVPVPQNAKNWLRMNFSTALKMDAFLTNAADKHYPGIWDGSPN